MSEEPDDAGWILLDHREIDETLGAANYEPYDFSISSSPIDITCIVSYEILYDGMVVATDTAEVTWPVPSTDTLYNPFA